MVAKSGCPVIGQTQVNSGHSIAISKGRSGFGFGNVWSSREGFVGMISKPEPERITARWAGWAASPCNAVPVRKASGLLVLRARSRHPEGTDEDAPPYEEHEAQRPSPPRHDAQRADLRRLRRGPGDGHAADRARTDAPHALAARAPHLPARRVREVARPSSRAHRPDLLEPRPAARATLDPQHLGRARDSPRARPSRLAPPSAATARAPPPAAVRTAHGSSRRALRARASSRSTSFAVGVRADGV